MAGRRKTAAQLRAEGSHHYPKEELARREQTEVHAPPWKELIPPSYLPPVLVAKFLDMAPTLAAMGVLTALDVDGLARYLLAEHNYLRVTNRLTAALNAGNTAEADKWSAVQDRFFRQCRAAGADLGLTAPGRSRLTVPSGGGEEVPEEVRRMYGED